MPMPISKGSILVSRSEVGGHAAGHAFAARSSRRIPAWLIWQGAEARLQAEDGALLVAGPVRRIEQMPGGPALVHLPEDWLFEAQDGADLDTLTGPRPDAHLSRLEVFHPRLIAVAAACIAAAFVIWRWGLDVIVAIAMALTPDPPVRAMDAGTMAMIDRLMAEETQIPAARQAEIRQIFDRLIAQAPDSPWGDYRLLFRDMPEIGPNAFAMPAGTIVVTDQLLQDFPEDDIIAGVLGHELAHVHDRHVLRQLYRAGSSYLLIALIAGDPGPFLQDLLLEGNALLSLSYSRGQESQADALGLTTAAAAGYDPDALALFFERLQRDYGEVGPDWLSIHPGTEDRILEIREQARALQ